VTIDGCCSLRQHPGLGLEPGLEHLVHRRRQLVVLARHLEDHGAAEALIVALEDRRHAAHRHRLGRPPERALGDQVFRQRRAPLHVGQAAAQPAPGQVRSDLWIAGALKLLRREVLADIDVLARDPRGRRGGRLGGAVPARGAVAHAGSRAGSRAASARQARIAGSASIAAA
jgi:hypothetical protein